MPLVRALLFLFNSLLDLVVLAIIVNAILSWLIAFDVLNVRNPTIYRVVRTLDGVTAPLLGPIRRFMPNLGGIDISPIILILLLQALRMVVNGYLGPLAYAAPAY